MRAGVRRWSQSQHLAGLDRRSDLTAHLMGDAYHPLHQLQVGSLDAAAQVQIILQADADSGAVNVYECSLQTIVWLDRLGLLGAEPSQALLS